MIINVLKIKYSGIAVGVFFDVWKNVVLVCYGIIYLLFKVIDAASEHYSGVVGGCDIVGSVVDGGMSVKI